MKKQLMILTATLMIGSAACMAQEGKSDHPDMSKRIEQMVSDLGLNYKQIKNFEAAMEEMKPGKNESGERSSREEMEKKRTKMDAKIKKILTDEQYEKYRSMQPQRKPGRGK